eukprot:SAG11_NODE_12_length_27025_cov_37.402681_28_plen_82_part_00
MKSHDVHVSFSWSQYGTVEAVQSSLEHYPEASIIVIGSGAWWSQDNHFKESDPNQQFKEVVRLFANDSSVRVAIPLFKQQC